MWKYTICACIDRVITAVLINSMRVARTHTIYPIHKLKDYSVFQVIFFLFKRREKSICRRKKTGRQELMPNGITNDKRKRKKICTLLPTHIHLVDERQCRMQCIRMHCTAKGFHGMYFGCNFSSSFSLQICCRLMIDWSCISCHLRLICILISNKLHFV